MSPRPVKSRQISVPLSMKGMRPYGCYSEEKEPVQLQFEEMESIRLCDYLGLQQFEASIRMGISRPTLTRVYKSARQKIATAMSEGRPIEFSGGQYRFEENWIECKHCQSAIYDPAEKSNLQSCVFCQNSTTDPIAGDSKKTFSYKYAAACSTSDNDSILSNVFARGPFFCLFGKDGGIQEFIDNPYWQDQQCVGENVIQLLNQQGVEVIIGADLGQKLLVHLQQYNMAFVLIRDSKYSTIKSISQILSADSMPKMDGKGPNVCGTEKGRGLGICKETDKENNFTIGQGMGKRRHQADAGQGNGKRVNYNKPKNINK